MVDIMQSCPSLASLELSQPLVPDFTSLRPTPYPKLTTFSFYLRTSEQTTSSFSANGDTFFTCNHIAAIGESFPSLKRLSFYPCKDIHVTDVVLNYYPWMKSLTIEDDDYDVGPHLTYIEQGPPCKDIGITDLTIRVSEPPNNVWTLLVHELRQYHKTVQHMHYSVFHEHEVEDGSEQLSDIEYPELKQLCLFHSGWWIPRNAPILEELDITCYVLLGDLEILDTVPPNVKKLHLDLDSGFDDRDSAEMEQDFQRLARHTQLKELGFVFCRMDNIESILHVTHQLWQLERLAPNFTDTWDYDRQKRFIDGLAKGCPNLAYLDIKYRNAPSTYFMKALKQLQHLEELAFSAKDPDDDDTFWLAVQDISQLKCIRIYLPNAANMDAIRRLQGQRCDLKIKFDRTYPRF